jgi:hypothetical protein
MSHLQKHIQDIACTFLDKATPPAEEIYTLANNLYIHISGTSPGRSRSEAAKKSLGTMMLTRTKIFEINPHYDGAMREHVQNIIEFTKEGND